MFFAKPGEYEPCGIFSAEHFFLLALTLLGIGIAVKHTDTTKKNVIKNNIQIITICAWILEIIKIIFNFAVGNGNNINTYIPLYYCSILLYAGIFSSIGKGKVKRIGDVFLATGGIIGGIIFLILPTTSITTYPMLHYLSLQSFAYHGAMLYIGIIINKSKYIEIENKDIIYYSGLLFVMCLSAYIVNNIFDSNLMFISKDFPGSPVTIIYKLTGKLFPLVVLLAQMILPFYTVIGIKNVIKKITVKKEQKNVQIDSINQAVGRQS